MRAYRRDANEQEIVALWKSLGGHWLPMHPSAGFDGLLFHAARVFIVEIKAANGHLTQTERDMQDTIEGLGVAYNVIHNLDEAAELIGMECE